MGRAWLALALGSSLACEGREPPSSSSSSDTTAAIDTSDTGATETSADGSSSGASGTGSTDDGFVPSLEVGTDVGAFFSVWGPQPGFVYATAGQPVDGGLSEGSLHRFDGEAWTTVPLPVDPPFQLNWVFGVGDRRFVVGDFGTIFVRDGDEGPWTQYGCETVLPLWGVWGIAPDDVWTVGGDGFNRDPIACHFDGEAFVEVPLPELSFESHALFKVWGTASDDVWSVGHDGLIVHWRGEAEGWVEVPSGTDRDLISLWGTGPDEILAVGGRTSGVLARWDGSAWTSVVDESLTGLNGVWMAADGTATVVGTFGALGVVAPGALTLEPRDSGTPLALHGVFGFDGVERWAVGGSLDMAPPHVGIVLRAMP